MILLSETFIYFPRRKKYPEMVISMTFQMNSKLYTLWIISVLRRIFQWKKGFLMVHMVWRWGNSFRPCYGVAKLVKLRCNLPWRHSIKLDSRPHYELRSTNATTSMQFVVIHDMITLWPWVSLTWFNKWILSNNSRGEVEGIIRQYSLSLRRIILLV